VKKSHEKKSLNKQRINNIKIKTVKQVLTNILLDMDIIKKEKHKERHKRSENITLETRLYLLKQLLCHDAPEQITLSTLNTLFVHIGHFSLPSVA
jgi:hypothetical protein